MFVKRFELQEVAPETRTAWEQKHNCSLDRLQHRCLVGWNVVIILLFLCLTPLLLAICLISVNPAFIPKTIGNNELLAVALFAGFVVTIFTIVIATAITDNAETNLRCFNQDILELKSKLSYGVADETLAIKGAKEALINMATSIILAELEDDTLRASATKKEMIELYEFFAGFNLTIVPKDKEGPRLRPYFDAARDRVELVVEGMVRKIGRHLTESQ